jgi:hypothetical protein
MTVLPFLALLMYLGKEYFDPTITSNSNISTNIVVVVGL